MVAPPIDPAHYALFTRTAQAVIQRFSQARVDTTLTGTRNDGSTFRYGRDFTPDELGEVPWDEYDAVINVTWHPGGMPDPANADILKRFGDSRIVKFHADTYNGGIGVVTSFGTQGQHVVGIAGQFRPKMPGIGRHTLPDEDALIAKLLEFLEEAYDVVDAKQHDADRYDDYGFGDGYDDEIDDDSRREIEHGQAMGFYNS